MISTLTRLILFYIAFLLPCLVFSKAGFNVDTSQIQSFESWVVDVTQVRYDSPDSAINLYQYSYEYYLTRKDTLSAVYSMIHKSIVYGHKADYQSAYDNLWKALLLADTASDKKAKVWVYIQLGRYFSFYKRKEKSLEYFHLALSLSKDLLEKDEAVKPDVSNCYYSLCSTYRELNEPIKARTYLDSCLMYNGNQMTPYLTFEDAYIKNATGQHQKALESMPALQAFFEKNSPSFQVLLFAYMGDIYVSLQDKNSAESYYKKALDISNKYKSH